MRIRDDRCRERICRIRIVTFRCAQDTDLEKDVRIIRCEVRGGECGGECLFHIAVLHLELREEEDRRGVILLERDGGFEIILSGLYVLIRNIELREDVRNLRIRRILHLRLLIRSLGAIVRARDSERNRLRIQISEKDPVLVIGRRKLRRSQRGIDARRERCLEGLLRYGRRHRRRRRYLVEPRARDARLKLIRRCARREEH